MSLPGAADAVASTAPTTDDDIVTAFNEPDVTVDFSANGGTAVPFFAGDADWFAGFGLIRGYSGGVDHCRPNHSFIEHQLPERVVPGQVGTWFECSWWTVIPGGSQAGEWVPLGNAGNSQLSTKWVWWTQMSDIVASRMLFCIADEQSPSSGFCFRWDQSGNRDQAWPRKTY